MILSQMPPNHTLAGFSFPTQRLPCPLSALAHIWHPFSLFHFSYYWWLWKVPWIHWLPSTISLSYPPAVLTASYLGGHSISNSRSHTRKLNFLLITSDSSLRSFIRLHFSFSLQRTAPVFCDKRWIRRWHTLLLLLVPLLLWLHHETEYKKDELCWWLNFMWPLP